MKVRRSTKHTSPAMQYWLIKSEPDAYSIDQLKRDRQHFWDGVRNYQARNYMRDDMKIGDKVIFYHSSTVPAGPVGIAEIATLPYPDHTQFDTTSTYFDPKSKKEKPTWIMVDVKFVRKFQRTITREEMKREDALKHMLLWKYMRLSITPLSQKEFDTIVTLADQ